MPVGPGLRSSAPLGRIRDDDDLHRSSPNPFGSLLQEGGLIPQELASEPQEPLSLLLVYVIAHLGFRSSLPG